MVVPSVPFGVLIPNLNYRRRPEAEQPLLGHKLEILDRDLDDLIRFHSARRLHQNRM